MATELRRGFVRLVSNYARLISTFILGLALAPLLLMAGGTEGFGLVSLLGATVGLLSIIREVANRSMTREIGSALHDPDPEVFRRTYSSACVLAWGAGLLAAVLFGLMVFALPLLKISPHLMPAAKWMLIIGATETFVRIAFIPQINLFMVQERFIIYNIMRTANKAASVVGALAGLLVFGRSNPGAALILFAAVQSGVIILSCLYEAVHMIASDRERFTPRLSHVSRAGLRSVLGTGSWNVAVSLSTSTHLRVDSVITNLFFGLFGNAVFGAAVRLGAYVRMLVSGVTSGIDAVTVRVTAKSDGMSVQELLRHSSRLNAFFLMPAVVFLVLYSRPAIELWLGPRFDNPSIEVPLAAGLSKVMAVALGAMAASEIWMGILYGAGFVHRYARVTILGAVINPAVAVGLILALPTPWKIYGPALGYATVAIGIHLCAIPLVVSRCLGVPYWRVLAPLAPPALIAIVSLPVLLAFDYFVQTWTLVLLLAAMGSYGAVYTGLCIALIMTPDERARFKRAIARRLGRARPGSGRRGGAAQATMTDTGAGAPPADPARPARRELSPTSFDA